MHIRFGNHTIKVILDLVTQIFLELKGIFSKKEERGDKRERGKEGGRGVKGGKLRDFMHELMASDRKHVSCILSDGRMFENIMFMYQQNVPLTGINIIFVYSIFLHQ